MKLSRGRASARAALLIVLVQSGAVSAQVGYPAKPIRIVIGTPAGGGSEVMARLVSQGFMQAWGQQYLVDPRPGASGNLAAERHGLLAPAATSAALADQLQGEVRRTLAAPAMKDKLAKDGIDVVASMPAELDAFMRADIEKWKKVITAAKIRLD